MKSRKDMKSDAQKILKRHYWLFLLLCLLAGVMGSEFSSSLTAVKNFAASELKQKADITTVGTTGIYNEFSKIVIDIAEGKEKEAQKIADENLQAQVSASSAEKKTILGRSRGVFSSLINGITSGTFLVSLAVGLRSIVGSDSIAVTLLIAAGLLFLFGIWIFVINLYQVILRRMFLESRCYHKVPAQRALFLLKAQKWLRAAVTLFTASLFQALWMLTVIGGVIKHYSYYLVPYIVAENPGMTAKEAITLSRRLMNGHKWECFLFELSFLGWSVLGILTLGLSDIFYANPYRIAAFSEYYVQLRCEGKQNQLEYTSLLDDRYLFEKADTTMLHKVYADVAQESVKPSAAFANLTGIRKFLVNVFGLTFRNDQKEKEFEEEQAKLVHLFYDKQALGGLIYPARLNPLPEKHKRKWIDNLHYIRCYSIWSVILIYFILSFVGWIWEVSLHLVSDGVFVNRGVLHGPWLPIYGTGSVLILLLLNKFRKKPAVELMAAIILCGFIEYFTAYYLEMTHNGQKWWDYTGYFLNLHGRICAEGLLIFGLGGMVIVYILAPLLDNIIKRIPFKTLVAVVLILICIFAADQIYSKKYPNQGKGITDYQSAATEYINSVRNC